MKEKKHGQWLKQFYRSSGYKIAYFLDKYTKITANQITYFRTFLGFITVFLFYSADGWLLKCSGVTLLLFGGLDAADGCLAQLQGKSYFGGWIDAMADTSMIFFLLLAISMRFNNIYADHYWIIILPLITFSIIHILGSAYSIRDSEKQFGDIFKKNQNKNNQPSPKGILDILKSQLVPMYQNYHLILIFGAVIGNMLVGVALLCFFVMFWLCGVFINTCKRGLYYDKLANEKNKR